MRSECYIIAIHSRDQAPVDHGAAGTAQRVVWLQGEGERAARILHVDDERVGRIFDGVGRPHVGLAAVEDQGVAAEIEQQDAAAILAHHAQADTPAEGSATAGREHFGEPGDQRRYA